MKGRIGSRTEKSEKVDSFAIILMGTLGDIVRALLVGIKDL